MAGGWRDTNLKKHKFLPPDFLAKGAKAEGGVQDDNVLSLDDREGLYC